jgi:hypothetical protein
MRARPGEVRADVFKRFDFLYPRSKPFGNAPHVQAGIFEIHADEFRSVGPG